jgi:hypothetical protein
LRAITLPAAAVFAVACGEVPSEVSHEGLHSVTAAREGTSRAAGLVKSVKAATARFSSREQATKAGYAEASPCVAVPGLGGMGFHWVNQGLVDPVFEPLRPEAVLYFPNAEGKLKLVAVEYIVINVGQPAPTFNGVPFDVGGTPVPVPHWSLHVWAHRTNPAGVFTPFNPALSCPDPDS